MKTSSSWNSFVDSAICVFPLLTTRCGVGERGLLPQRPQNQAGQLDVSLLRSAPASCLQDLRARNS